jgi:hypothetical protein
MSARRKGGQRMKRKIVGAGSERIAKELAGLVGLPREELKQRWRALYGGEPPEKSSREFLRAAIAYRLQERAFGGLRPETRRLLERVARGASARKPIRVKPVRKTPPGTVLIREWHGVPHQVTVLDDGAIYRGKRYRSLSEIARAITGSRWSGPLFFGLKASAKERVNAEQ